jgi:hypothetical protein
MDGGREGAVAIERHFTVRERALTLLRAAGRRSTAVIALDGALILTIVDEH